MTALTRKDVAVTRSGYVRIKATGEEIGSLVKMQGWWVTFPRTCMHDYREDAIAALIERWNAEHAG